MSRQNNDDFFNSLLALFAPRHQGAQHGVGNALEQLAQPNSISSQKNSSMTAVSLFH